MPGLQLHRASFSSYTRMILSGLEGTILKHWMLYEIILHGAREARSDMNQSNLEMRIAALSLEKQALLEQLLSEQGTNFRTYDVSPSQRGLWFLDQLLPGSSLYNVPWLWRLRGCLNVSALEQAFDEVIIRHKVLRSQFKTIEGQPVLFIAANAGTGLLVVDLRGNPEEEREAAVQRLADQEARQPFDLTLGPLLRAYLLRITDLEQILLVNIHHIVFDGWSMGVLLRELATLYRAFCEGLPSPLPELSIQYTDFASWQQQWLQSAAFQEQLAYWRQQLAGIPTILGLPTDRPRPAIQRYVGSTLTVTLPGHLCEELQSLARRERATLFMVLLAVWKVLLFRYTGQQDIVVGSPVAGRSRPELEDLIGFFVNTLVLRTHLASNLTFRQLVAQMRETVLQAYIHQNMPLDKLVEELQPDRVLSHHPLFQVMFALEDDPAQTIELPGLSVGKIEDVLEVTAKFDLTLTITGRKGGLSAEWEYNTDLFDEATIVRMAEHWQLLLAAVVADSTQPVGELLLLTERERHQLLVEWNNTQASYPKERSIHQLFAEQVERTPDSIAVTFEEASLTYRELNTRANQLAHYLQTLGVGPDVLVAICIERSLEMLVGLLSILKAGGAYVPLDPTYPVDRLAFMLADAGVTILVTQQGLIAQLPNYPAKVVCLDADAGSFSHLSQTNPTTLVTAEHLCYVIYTSGSTGRPKGVQIPHRAVVNFLLSMQREPALSTQDTLLAVTTLSFDIAGLELYLPLIIGASLVIGSQNIAISGVALAETLERTNITVMQATPITWRVLLASGWQGKADLKALCGGEALPIELARDLLPRIASLYNMYGPTETTIWSMLYKIQPEDNMISIGHPIANTSIAIMDRYFQLVPVGIPGEIYIGGEGLARGYLNRPELTAERFIPDPFSPKPHARLYKTGDLGRYLSNGNIEFLGRVDQQVKIRGFRIEVGEIEEVLRKHQTVENAVVVVREDKLGEKVLIAYIVSVQVKEPSSNILWSYLKEQLPSYMLPSAFVFLDVLPLSPNGKLDRKALPVSEDQRSGWERRYVAPRTPVEEILINIWSEVLGLSRIGIRDNFFEIGGHSFAVMRLIHEIEKILGHTITAETLFQAPTIEQIAKLFDVTENTKDNYPLVAIRPTGSQRPFFCVHPVGGSVLCYANLAYHLGAERPVYGFEALGIDGRLPPHVRIEDMAAYYVKSLKAAGHSGPYLLGGWSMGGVVAFEMARQIQRQFGEVAVVVMLDSWATEFTDPQEWDDALLVKWFAEDWGHSIGSNLQVSYDILHQIEPNEQVNYILDCAKAIGAVSPDTDTAYLRQVMEVFKANMQALHKYRPEDTYSGKLVVFSVAEELSDSADPALGWGALTNIGVEVKTVPGDHYSIMREPNVRYLASELKSCLEHVLE